MSSKHSVRRTVLAGAIALTFAGSGSIAFADQFGGRAAGPGQPAQPFDTTQNDRTQRPATLPDDQPRHPDTAWEQRSDRLSAAPEDQAQRRGVMPEDEARQQGRVTGSGPARRQPVPVPQGDAREPGMVMDEEQAWGAPTAEPRSEEQRTADQWADPRQPSFKSEDDRAGFGTAPGAG